MAYAGCEGYNWRTSNKRGTAYPLTPPSFTDHKDIEFRERITSLAAISTCLNTK